MDFIDKNILLFILGVSAIALLINSYRLLQVTVALFWEEAQNLFYKIRKHKSQMESFPSLKVLQYIPIELRLASSILCVQRQIQEASQDSKQYHAG